MHSLSVVIVGGGIGGLTAALCLARTGHQVTVLERAERFEEVGAGIQVSPNAARVLHALGLEAALRAKAFLPESTEFRTWRSGWTVSRAALGAAAVKRYGAPYYHMHRGDLLMVLYAAAAALPNIRLRTGAQVCAVEPGEASATVRTPDQVLEADLVIGADGIHSMVRESLWGTEPARFTGNVAWRALVPVDRLPPGLVRPVASVWWGPGKHFVHYFVRGGQLVNCVCVVEKSGWEVESWTEPGELEELRADFDGWHSGVTKLIDAIPDGALYKWALHDRAPMQGWSRGVVTLLGDACHPTLPFMAQGAAMAIEDSAVLAAALKTLGEVGREVGGEVATCLQRYEAARLKRTAAIQTGSRRNASVFHLRGAPAIARNLGARFAGRHSMDKLYRYNALTALQPVGA